MWESLKITAVKNKLLFCLSLRYELLFLSIFYWLCYYICPIFISFIPLWPAPSSHTFIPSPLTSCPWVLHISSLASTFPIIFSIFPSFVPTNYASYSLYLFSHSPLSPFLLKTFHIIFIFVILLLFLLFA